MTSSVSRLRPWNVVVAVFLAAEGLACSRPAASFRPMPDDTPVAEFPVVVRMDGSVFISAEEARAAGFTPGTPLRLQARRDERDFRALLEAEIAAAEAGGVDEDKIMDEAVDVTRQVRKERARRDETGSGQK